MKYLSKQLHLEGRHLNYLDGNENFYNILPVIIPAAIAFAQKALPVIIQAVTWLNNNVGWAKIDPIGGLNVAITDPNKFILDQSNPNIMNMRILVLDMMLRVQNGKALTDGKIYTYEDLANILIAKKVSNNQLILTAAVLSIIIYQYNTQQYIAFHYGVNKPQFFSSDPGSAYQFVYYPIPPVVAAEISSTDPSLKVKVSTPITTKSTTTVSASTKYSSFWTWLKIKAQDIKSKI